jgi:hypothetical protein
MASDQAKITKHLFRVKVARMFAILVEDVECTVGQVAVVDHVNHWRHESERQVGPETSSAHSAVPFSEVRFTLNQHHM